MERDDGADVTRCSRAGEEIANSTLKESGELRHLRQGHYLGRGGSAGAGGVGHYHCGLEPGAPLFTE